MTSLKNAISDAPKDESGNTMVNIYRMYSASDGEKQYVAVRVISDDSVDFSGETVAAVQNVTALVTAHNLLERATDQRQQRTNNPIGPNLNQINAYITEQLTSVLSNLQQLQAQLRGKKAMNKKQVLEEVNCVFQQMTLLHCLASDVLDMDSISQGTYEQMNEKFDPSTISVFLQSIFKHQINDKNIFISCESVSSYVGEQFAECGGLGQVMLPVSALPKCIYGDKQRLKQILVNLIFDEISLMKEHDMVRVVSCYDYGQS